MTAPATFIAALRTEVADFLTALTIPFAFDNGALATPTLPALWAQIHVILPNSEAIEIGDDVTERHYGWLQVNVMTPLGDGDGAAITLREAVATKYQIRNAFGAEFGAPDRPPGFGAGPVWVTPVKCPFFFDQAVAIT